MKKLIKVLRNRSGSALVTVLLVAVIVMVLAGGVSAITSQMPVQVRRMSDAVRAKAIAEAGINQAYSALSQNFALRHNAGAFPLTVFAGGDYAVTVVTVDAAAARLISVGRYGVATVRVGMDIRNAGAGGTDASDPFNPWRYAMFANGNLRLNGTPPAVRGGLHTNQQFWLSGNPSNIEGSVTARSFNWTGGQLPDDQIGGFIEIPFPQLTDPYFVALHQIAQANGAVRGAGTYRQDDLDKIPGGVAWFTGNVSLHGSYSYDGIIIVTGNITFLGSGTRTLSGLMFTPGNIEANGSTELVLTGSMMAGGNITYNGASSIFTHATVGPGAGNGGADGEDRIVVTAWWEG